MQTLIDFFDIQKFIPHGYCLSWNPVLLWLHVASDLIITLSYYSIPLSLLYFIRKRENVPYAWLIVMMALFIVACGTTHLMSAILIWIPLYWFDGYLKVFTAIISVATAIAMLRIIPQALKLPSASQLQAEINNRIQAEFMAQEAAERLHKIANQLPNIVFQFRMHVDGSVSMPYANEVFHNVYRLHPEDVREDASAIFALTHPDDLASHIEKIKASAQNLSPWRDEYRLKFEDGTERWLSGNALPQREADGSTLWHGFVEDITERKQIDVNFQKERDKTLALLRNASDGITILSDKGNLIECSDSFCTMLGYSREEIIGMHVSEWEVGVPKSEIMDIVTAQFKQPARIQFESRHLRKDGTTYDTEISGCPIEFDGECVLFNSTRDVTQRKYTEKALKASEERLNLSQKYGEIGSWEADLINNKQIWSQAMFHLVKLPVMENLTWEDFFSLIHPDDKQRVLEANQIHLVDKEKYDIEYRVILAGGQIRWMRSVGRAEFLQDGTPIRFAGIAQDITERKKIEQALQESEFRWKFAIEGSGDGLWDWNVANRTVFFSTRWKEMLGFQDDEIGNGLDQWEKRIHPDDNDEVMTAVQSYFEGKSENYVNEHRVLCKNGSYKWILDRGMIVARDEAGNPLRMIGTHTDIDKRKHDEQALKESEARFRSIIDISPVPLALNDNQQNIIFLNNAFTKTFGYDLDDIPTLSEWWEKAYPDSNYRSWVLDTWATTLKQCELENTSVPPMELTICCKDGTQKTVLVSATAISDSFDLHLVALYDITERKKNEEKLQKFFNIIPDLLCIVSDGYFININPAWKAVLGHSEQTLLSTPFREFIHPDDIETTDNEVYNQLYAGKLTMNFLNRYRHKNGQYRWLEWQAVASSDNKLLFAAARDVTERFNIEAELKRSNADLEQFAYAVSHDMRQPLRMVTSYLSLIEKALETQLDDDTRQFLTFAVDGAKRMDSMILSLLDYSRVGRQTMPLAFISTRLAVDEALAFLKPALETSGGQVHLSGDWIDLVASRDELTRLFQNLIGNALKYHDENKPPHVDIVATVISNSFRVEVRDNGIGINPNQIDRLFKVFSRLQARNRFEGTGVGLALCRKIVEHHGGTIGVTSEGDGLGCVFWFELPRKAIEG